MKFPYRSHLFKGLFVSAFCLTVGGTFLSPIPLQARTNVGVSMQSTRTLTGKVIDSEGLPLPGVTVRLKGSKLGTMTDINGAFRLKVPDNKQSGILVFSYVGMKETVVSFSEKSGPLTVTMEEDSELLKEVVVTGYQTISKERATGSFAMVNEKDLKRKVSTNILPQLEGKVPGLVIKESGSMAIRGQSTLRGVSQPLIVVDGMPYEGALSDLNPALIRDVTVLKDAAASSIYGARAANGVIVIRTVDGGDSNKTKISYQGNLSFTSAPNVKDLHLMSTKDLLDLNVYGTQFKVEKSDRLDPRRYTDPFAVMLLKWKEGKVTEKELNDEIERLSAINNTKELSEYYLRNGFDQQHTLSLSGGNERYGYVASIDFEKDLPTDRFSKSQDLGFSLRNRIKFFDWFTADVGLYGRYGSYTDDPGVLDFNRMLRLLPPFRSLRDPETGTPSYVPLGYKSPYELQRLKDKGLLDEFYNPISNEGKETIERKNANYRLNMGLNFDLTHGLGLELRYQGEWGYSSEKSLYGEDSWTVHNMVNDAASINPETRELKYNIPLGGQSSQGNGESNAYTLRAQLNYRLEHGDHYFTALGGTELRSIRDRSRKNYYFGYDDSSLGHKSINADDLNFMQGTESLDGNFQWSYTDNNHLYETEDRFVSLYANASYSYLSRYDLTGSIRVDQSNLFGTDPRYQYRPMWSLGGSWHMAKEDFMSMTSDWLERLTLRLTYGIGGNVPKDAGPYLMLQAPDYNGLLGDFGSGIIYPPNPTLRWEKTATTNVGLDFSILRRKLFGSVDFYYKNTTDLLAYRQVDPTFGFDTQLQNYGSLRNLGVEIGLHGDFEHNGLRWNPSLVFSYNDNKLLNVEDDTTNAFDRTKKPVNVQGKTANSLYSYHLAGLSHETGLPKYYNAKGEKVDYITDINDLVYSGTVIPKVNVAMTNILSYRDLSFSFMITYEGGHIFRNVVPAFISSSSLGNYPVEYRRVWKKPGDETIRGIAPAYTGRAIPTQLSQAWQNSDATVLPGDIIKLRDVTVSYQLPSQWLRIVRMDSMRVMLQGQNLFAIGLNKLHVNPENYTTNGYSAYGAASYTFLPSRVFSIGLSLGF